MRLGRWTVLAVGIAAAACASTIGPVVPSVQVLVVLDSIDDTLRIIPVDSPDIVHKIVPGFGAAFNKHALALRGQFAAIGAGSTAFSVDLTSNRVICTAPSLGGAISSLAFDDNGLVYAAIPLTNNAPHFEPTSQQGICPTGGGYVRGGPRAFVSARSKFFVVTGDRPDFPSWLSKSTQQTNDNVALPPGDSIPLSLPGHAQGAVLASDGFLYVINAGSGLAANARLSQVDPVQSVELNVYNGFGTLPQYIATDGDRVFVASATEGLMVFNTRTKQVERDFRSAIPFFGAIPKGLAADDVGRVYVLIAGPCTPAGQGSVRIFGSDLVSRSSVNLGTCPVAIGVTDIPAALYHFSP